MSRRFGNELDREEAGRLPVDPGLCASCTQLRILTSRTSAFVRCGKAEEDGRFPRYPPLPVVQCAGYERVGGLEG